MYRSPYLIQLVLIVTGFARISLVYGSENVTLDPTPLETLVNLTGNNDLWSVLLKDCDRDPTLTCVQNNVFHFLKRTLDETDDLQFTSFLRFTKNQLDYGKVERSFDNDTVLESYEDDEFPIESISRSLQNNAARFFFTHDLEVALPDGLFPNSVLKIAPRGLQDRGGGALVNLDIVTKDVQPEGRTFKKIRKFISEQLIYALLAILLVVKLLAVKFLFLVPLLVGAATAKKLLLKVLLFVFPFLHHVFKLCAYYPIQAKFHHHKHLISHIHQVAPSHHHHGEEYVEGPPHIEHGGHYTEEFDDDVSVVPHDGSGFPHGLISNRKDPTFGQPSSLSSSYNRKKPGRPPPSSDIERIIAKAEREAIIKARLEKERIRIREENLRLQEQLNQAIKLQEKLKLQQAAYYNSKKGAGIKPGSFHAGKPVNVVNPPPIRGSIFDEGPGIELPAGYIPQHSVPQRTPDIHQHYPYYQQREELHFNQAQSAHVDQQYQNSQTGPIASGQIDIQKSVEYDPRIKGTDLASQESRKDVLQVPEKPVSTPATTSTTQKPKLEQAIYQAASITYDKFYSPILEKIDKILQGLGFGDEPCKERLVCSMYKNPAKFSPHSNLLSVELSRETSELQKPTATNSAVIRFYKYVQAARDGQDQRDCLRLYPGCPINTEVS